jgi:flagellar biosynthetic protein FlhB
MAEEQDPESKTEDPTPKRLQEARNRGQVAQSKEVGNFLLFLSIAIMLTALIPNSIGVLSVAMKNFLSRPESFQMDAASIGKLLFDVMIVGVKAAGPPILFMMVIGIISGPLQFGLILSADSLMPKFSKISPMAGLKRLFSMKAMVEFIKSLLKITIVSVAGYYVLKPVADDIQIYPMLDIEQSLNIFQDFLGRLFLMAVLVVGAIALMDILYQRYEFNKEMRMTRQEVRDEFKQSEGDPHIKQRLRRLRMERARKRMMTNVPMADVIITNPTHYAVALKYDPDNMEAPQLIAKGTDLVALRIRDLGQEHEVPIVENPPLARTLHAVYEIDQFIMPEHYQAVAEIISYVFQLKRRKIRPTITP